MVRDDIPGVRRAPVVSGWRQGAPGGARGDKTTQLHLALGDNPFFT